MMMGLFQLFNFLVFLMLINNVVDIECSAHTSLSIGSSSIAEKEFNFEKENFTGSHDYFKVDFEKLDDKQPAINSKTDNIFQDPKKQNQLMQLMRGFLKKEIRKIKSSMTDSIMEEVINYYGKKLDLTDTLKQEMDTLNKKIVNLNESNHNLNHNYKNIIKSHRILVDNFRSLLNAKKEKEALAAKDSQMKAAKPISKNSTNTRALSENLRKKSIDQNHFILKTLASSTNKITLVKAHDEHKQEISSLIDKTLPETDASNKTSLMETGVPSNIYKIVVRQDEIMKNAEKYDINNKKPAKINQYERSNKEINSVPLNCQDLRDSGIKLNGVYKVSGFEVLCEFENKIAYTVLQYRHDGTVSFYESWNNYKNGFGMLQNNGEFWLGLEKMHILTSQNNYSLQIIMTDWKNEKYIAEYGFIKIGNENSKYKLEIDDYYKNSSSGDSLGSSNTEQSHNNMPFSTFDADNDNRFYDNCAQIFRSGWWFNACFQSNLNGLFSEESNQIKFLRNGIIWGSIDVYKSLKSTKIRIRKHL